VSADELVDAELVEEGKGYESISRDALQDCRLSFKARGIMAYLKSKPPKWKTSTKAIAGDSGKDGYEAVNNGIKELEALGYLARLKRQGGRGRWEWLWVYSDSPSAVAKRVARWEEAGGVVAGKSGPQDASPPQPPTVSGKPEHGQPEHGQAGSGQAVSGGPPNKEEIQKRDPEEATTSSTAPPPRDDVERLCHRLRERMIGNGCKPPTITDSWRTSARLLLDKDGRDLDKALNLLDWATADEFWMANVQSMGKFRAQYDRLRLLAIRDHEQKKRTAAGPQRRSQTAVAVESTRSAFEQYRAELATQQAAPRALTSASTRMGVRS
jgi:hypothetical protein